MITALIVLISFLAGVLTDRLWMKYMEEDLALMRSEAHQICNRLDKLLTEIKQRYSKIDE